MWSVFSKTCQYQSHGMSGRQQHSAQQNCHVITIARTQFQHSSRRVQELHSEDVSRIANIAFDEIKERTRFTHSVLWGNPVSPKDFNRFLSNVKILCACSNELPNYFRGAQCAFRSSRSECEVQHAGWETGSFTNAQNPFERHDHFFRKTFYVNLNKRSVNQATFR
jgi:hypothetical protein